MKNQRRQIIEKEGKLPTAVIACAGGGSNAIGAFAHYIDDEDVRLIGVEPDRSTYINRRSTSSSSWF